MNLQPSLEVSVIVPARNEAACLGECLRSLVTQEGVSCEIIVVDDHSTDATREIAASFPVQVIAADPLPAGWSGKCNAAWSGAQDREREVAAVHRRRYEARAELHRNRHARSDRA